MMKHVKDNKKAMKTENKKVLIDVSKNEVMEQTFINPQRIMLGWIKCVDLITNETFNVTCSKSRISINCLCVNILFYQRFTSSL